MKINFQQVLSVKLKMSPGNGSFCCILQRLLTMSVLLTYILLLFSGFCIGHSLQGISRIKQALHNSVSAATCHAKQRILRKQSKTGFMLQRCFGSILQRQTSMNIPKPE